MGKEVKGKDEMDVIGMKTIMKYIVETNIKLAKDGKMPVAMEIEGQPGTAKTSLSKQVAAEYDAYYVRRNLAEIEVCDLVGLPTYEYEVRKDKEVKWVSDKVLHAFATLGYAPTGEVRTGNAKPSWIHGKEDKPIVLVLDDYNRSSPMMTNACMTLIDEQRYDSWELPAGSTIILTCNPSDGDFFVQNEDNAQETRRLKFYLKASVDAWASEFAEPYGVDSRCINFLLKHPEIIEGAVEIEEEDKGKLVKGNLRIWTKYFDVISNIENFSDDIPLLLNLGTGSLPKEHVLLFVSFIKQDLDKLPTPKQIFTESQKWVEDKLLEVIKTGKMKRQDISAIITKRIVNYCLAHEDKFTDDNVERLAEVFESDHVSSDLVLNAVRKFITIPKFRKLMSRKKFKEMILNS